MAGNFLTPPATATPLFETPTSGFKTEEQPKKPTVNVTKSFQELRQLDRTSVQKYVDRVVWRSGKWEKMTPEDRRDAIRKEMDKKLKERDYPRATAKYQNYSARVVYPKQWDEEEELEWLVDFYNRKQMRAEIADARASEVRERDQDDEEELPTRSGLKIKQEMKVKQESMEDEDDGDSLGSLFSRQQKNKTSTERDGDDAEEVEEATREERVTCKAVSRSLGIRIGCGSVSEMEPAVKALRADARCAALRVSNDKCGFGVAEAGVTKAVKRSWKFVHGEMAVWPPFEGPSTKKARTLV